jgi:hypothetical protein
MKKNVSHRNSILYYLNILDEEKDKDVSSEEID